MAEGVKKTISDSAIYGGGQLLHKSVGFLMLPVYTRYLSPEDYGILSLLSVAIETVAIFFGMQIVEALFRYYYESDDVREQNRLISTTLIVTVFLKVCAAILIVVLSAPLAGLFLGDPTLNTLVALFAITLISDVAMYVPMQYLRALNKPKSYVAVSVVRLLSQLSMNIWFLAFMGYGIAGVIYSNLISGLAIGGALIIWTLNRTGLAISLVAARKLLGYSWPLVVSGLLVLYANQVGSVSLSHVHGLAQVGILSLALKFDAITRLLVTEPFMQAWGPQRFRVYKQANSIEIYQRVFIVYLFGVVAIATGVALFSENIIRIMATEQYWPAARLVPVACLFSVVGALNQYCRFSVLIKDRTREVPKAMLAMSIVASAILVATIQSLGALSAVLSLVFGSLACFLWIAHKGRQCFDMHLPWDKFGWLLMLGVTTYGLSTLLPEEQVFSLTGKLILFFSFIVLSYYSPIFGNEGRQVANEYIDVIKRMRRV